MHKQERPGRILALIFGLLGLMVSYQNCGSVMKPKVSLVQGSKCHSPSDLHKMSFINRTQKLNIVETKNTNDNSIGPQKYTHIELEEGRQFVALIDEECVQSWPSSWSAGQVTLNPNAEPILRAYPITLNSTKPLSEFTETLENDSCVISVSDNATFTLSNLPSDPAVTNNTAAHFTTILANEGYSELLVQQGGLQGSVVIAIIDTGVFLQHPDLAQALWINEREVPNNGIDDDQNGYIDDINGWNFANNNNDPNPSAGTDNKHGTHVAGLAAASGGNNIGSAGINYNHAKIMALNVFGATPGSSAAALVSAIRYAAANGAKIINMSLGTSSDIPDIEAAIREANQAGVFVVAAAGNEGVEMDSNPSYPAYYTKSLSGVISVGASAPNNLKCGFSNFGANAVDLGAPGCGTCGSQNCSAIYSTYIEPPYEFIAGTSMSSPIVAGAASLAYLKILKLAGRNPTPFELKTVLMESSVKIISQSAYFKSGNVLNLKGLGMYLNSHYNLMTNAPADQMPNCL